MKSVFWALALAAAVAAAAYLGTAGAAALTRATSGRAQIEDALIAQVRATHPATRSSTGAGDGTEAMLAALAQR